MRRYLAAIGGVLIVLSFIFPTALGTVPLDVAPTTVNFSCLSQSSALLLIEQQAPGGMAPDGGVNGCPGLWDGYYTPGSPSQPSCPPECVTTGSTTLQEISNGMTTSTVFVSSTVTVTSSGGTTTTITFTPQTSSTTSTSTVTSTTTQVTTSTTTSSSTLSGCTHGCGSGIDLPVLLILGALTLVGGFIIPNKKGEAES